MSDLFQAAYDQLFSWCQQRDFAGHDPFDALNSRLFQATPLAQSRNARFIWTQVVKRSPADVRAVIRVPAERNAKGIALFTLAQIANHRRLKSTQSEFAVRDFLSGLLSMQIDGYSGACWGYNFDWQSRNFFAPRNTPTIVPTAFAARALIEAEQDFPDLLKEARSVCDFIINDLPRTVDTETELCFSYAPNTDTRIFNATLLAAEVLAAVRTVDLERFLFRCGFRHRRFRLPTRVRRVAIVRPETACCSRGRAGPESRGPAAATSRSSRLAPRTSASRRSRAPCTTEWIDEVGYVTIPTLALTGFALVFSFLLLAALGTDSAEEPASACIANVLRMASGKQPKRTRAEGERVAPEQAGEVEKLFAAVDNALGSG